MEVFRYIVLAMGGLFECSTDFRHSKDFSSKRKSWVKSRPQGTSWPKLRVPAKPSQISRRKAMFVALLFTPFLGMFAYCIINWDFEKCYYCLRKEDHYFSFKFDYKRNTFMTVPESNCEHNPPFLVLLVTTTHDQQEARMAVRKTWGQERLIQGKRVVTFFLLGTSINPSTDDIGLPEEVQTYKDIIQKDFVDSYYNLTIKTLMGIDWIVHYCPQTSYVMKTDTDMFINTLYLVELLLRKNQTTDLFTGLLKINDPPVRNIFNKWYISKTEYGEDMYPPFCSGTGYVFSVDIAQKVYKIYPTIPYFKLEDVYIGICLNKLKVPLQELHSEEVFFVSKPAFSICTYRNLVTSHGILPTELINFWEALQEAQEEHC
ncbi:beta-1,3-galactosyltransferase 5 [Gastrophryne carolinensis]